MRPPRATVEVDVLSKAYDAATRPGRGADAAGTARLIGAHGVVGVRLSLVRHEWADKTVEVQAIGTAVEGPGPAPNEPWLSDLSGQEWWALHRAGYVPAALVWGLLRLVRPDDPGGRVGRSDPGTTRS